MINDQNFLQIQFGNKKKMEKRNLIRERESESTEQKKFNKFQECRDTFCFALFGFSLGVIHWLGLGGTFSAQPLS